MNNRFIPLREAAELLNISPHTLYRWIEQKKYVPHVRLGGKIMFELEKLEAWIRENSVDPGKPQEA